MSTRKQQNTLQLTTIKKFAVPPNAVSASLTKSKGFCVADFATLSDERRPRSKIVQLCNVDKNPCVRKFEGLTRSKILGILQTEMNYLFTILFDFREIKHNLQLVSYLASRAGLQQSPSLTFPAFYISVSRSCKSTLPGFDTSFEVPRPQT